MSTPVRSTSAVLLIGMALLAAAITPSQGEGGEADDFVGGWITWMEPAGGERPVCRRLHVSAGSGAVRHGGWNAPGWNGLAAGEVVRGRDGRPVWQGEWRDGRLAGSFRLGMADADALAGTFTAPGTDAPRPVHGRRDTGQDRPDVPCAF